MHNNKSYNKADEDDLMERYTNALEGWKGHWILQHRPKPIDTAHCNSCAKYSAALDYLADLIEKIPHHGSIPPRDVQDG